MQTTTINRLLDLSQEGSDAAVSELIEIAYESFRSKSRSMLRQYASVRAEHETDDILHDAAIRLERALRASTPESALHFFRLVGVQIRRTLIDLARRFASRSRRELLHHVDPTDDRSDDDPLTLAEWTDFHESVQQLPEADRTVFDLLWYGNLSQDEAAHLLGVSRRTVQRRWLSARLRLAEAFDGEVES